MTTGRINQVASFNDANNHNTVVGSICYQQTTGGHQAVVHDERINALTYRNMGVRTPLASLTFRIQKPKQRCWPHRYEIAPIVGQRSSLLCPPNSPKGSLGEALTNVGNYNSFGLGIQHRKPDVVQGKKLRDIRMKRLCAVGSMRKHRAQHPT